MNYLARGFLSLRSSAPTGYGYQGKINFYINSHSDHSDDSPIYNIESEGSETSTKVAPTKPLGVKNVGNTYYISSILQVLSVVPSIRLSINNLMPLRCTLLKAMQYLLKVINTTVGNHPSVDPSSFVDALNKLLIKDNPLHRIGQQQDADEIMLRILSEFNSPKLNHLLSSELLSVLQCSICKTSSSSKEVISIFQLPVNIILLEKSFEQLLSPEILEGENKWYCPNCCKCQPSTRTSYITSLARVLIVQFKCFSIIMRTYLRTTKKINIL